MLELSIDMAELPVLVSFSFSSLHRPGGVSRHLLDPSCQCQLIVSRSAWISLYPWAQASSGVSSPIMHFAYGTDHTSNTFVRTLVRATGIRDFFFLHRRSRRNAGGIYAFHRYKDFPGQPDLQYSSDRGAGRYRQCDRIHYRFLPY